jgi:hypothetical protein
MARCLDHHLSCANGAETAGLVVQEVNRNDDGIGDAMPIIGFASMIARQDYAFNCLNQCHV